MGYWLGAADGIAFTPSRTNLACTEEAETVPALMAAHSRKMDPGVLEVVGRRVYQFIGYALSNSTLVIGDGGLILIDPPEDVEKGQVWIEFDGAAQVAQLRRTVTENGKKTVDVVYLITSDRHADPAVLAAWVRSHWEIENKLHWVRGVTYQEDKSLVGT